MDNYIFVSYAHKDSDEVVSIIEELQKSGFNIWYDSGIEAGTEWPEYIAEKLNGSDVVIAFLSKNAVESQNCRNEINFAIQLKKKILVVYIEEFELTLGMQLQLNSLQAMFKYRSPDTQSFIRNLSEAVILKSCRLPRNEEKNDSQFNHVNPTSVQPEAVKPAPVQPEPKAKTAPVKEIDCSETTIREAIIEAINRTNAKYGSKCFTFWQELDFQQRLKISIDDKPDEIIAVSTESTTLPFSWVTYTITPEFLYINEIKKKIRLSDITSIKISDIGGLIVTMKNPKRFERIFSEDGFVYYFLDEFLKLK